MHLILRNNFRRSQVKYVTRFSRILNLWTFFQKKFLFLFSFWIEIFNSGFVKTCDELLPRFFFWILRKFLVFTLMVAEISWREEMDACRCWLKQFCLVPSCTRLKGKEMKEKIIKIYNCLHMNILAKKYGSSRSIHMGKVSSV